MMKERMEEFFMAGIIVEIWQKRENVAALSPPTINLIFGSEDFKF